MRLFRVLGVLATVVAAGGLLLVAAPSIFGQDRTGRPDRRASELMMLAGRGAEIGVSVRDVEEADLKKTPGGGVLVEEVRTDSPADKAGLKGSDILIEFDGEHVRSARQFARLVQETPPGRTVKATVMRDGQKRDLQITPGIGRAMSLTIDGDRIREGFGDLGKLADRLAPFNFDFDISGMTGARRLGATVEEMSSQLADHFGVKDGLLVTAVEAGSAGAKAGLKAGDVITSLNGEEVRSRSDLVRGLRDAKTDDVTVGIVRDKKESMIKTTIEAPSRMQRNGRPA